MHDYLQDAALIASFALIVVVWCLYNAAIAGGYRVDPEQTNRSRYEWRDLAIAFPLMMASFWALETWKDDLMASLALTKSGYGWLRTGVVFFVLIAVGRFLEHRRKRGAPTPSI